MREVKINTGWQVINARTDYFMEFQRVVIIDILSEFIGGLLFFTIGEIELTNRVTIEGSLIPLDHRVIAVDPHRPVIVRNRKGEDLPVQLFLALYRPKKFDKSSYGDGYTVRVLAISNIESGSAVLYFAGEEGKVYPVSRDEQGVFEDAANKLIELLELLVGKYRSSEANRVVRFRQ